MTEIGQTQTVFSGEVALGSANKLHFRRQDLAAWTTADSDTAVGVTHEFFDGISSAFSTALSIQVDQNVAVLDQATGTLLRDVPASGPEGVVTGGGTGDEIRGVGMRLRLFTSAILRGRHVSGAVMLVPSDRATFDSSGNVGATTITLVNTHTTTLIAHANAGGLDLVVWARPNVPKGYVGTCFPVNSAALNPSPAGLRKRR